MNLAETAVIANRAYKWFFEGDFSVNDEEEDLTDIDFEDAAEYLEEKSPLLFFCYFYAFLKQWHNDTVSHIFLSLKIEPDILLNFY